MHTCEKTTAHEAYTHTCMHMRHICMHTCEKTTEPSLAPAGIVINGSCRKLMPVRKSIVRGRRLPSTSDDVLIHQRMVESVVAMARRLPSPEKTQQCTALGTSNRCSTRGRHLYASVGMYMLEHGESARAHAQAGMYMLDQREAPSALAIIAVIAATAAVVVGAVHAVAVTVAAAVSVVAAVAAVAA